MSDKLSDTSPNASDASSSLRRAQSRAQLWAYLLISAVLLLPVLSWPMLLLTDIAMNPAANIAGHWRIAALALLMMAASGDSVLTAQADGGRALMPAAAWLTGMGLWGAWASARTDGHWLLGVLFFIHALRSAHRLWRGASDWWLWPAWGRDMLAAMALFIWPWIVS